MQPGKSVDGHVERKFKSLAKALGYTVIVVDEYLLPTMISSLFELEQASAAHDALPSASVMASESRDAKHAASSSIEIFSVYKICAESEHSHS